MKPSIAPPQVGERSRTPLVRTGVPLACAISAGTGLYWLVGWMRGIPQELVGTSIITMKTNMAVAQVMAALALFILTRKGGTRGLLKALALALAIVVLAIGVLTLAQYATHLDFGIDQLIFTEPPGALGVSSPNRMGPLGAISLTLVGIGLAAIVLGRRSFAPQAGIAVCLLGLVPAIGYIYGVTSFFGAPKLTAIAWPTVIALFALGFGLILSDPESGALSMLLRKDAGGILLRRLLPVTLIAPIGLGYLRTVGEDAGLYGTLTGRAVLVLSFVLIFSVLLWVSATRLSRSAETEATTLAALRHSEERFRLIFDRTGVGVVEVDATQHFIAANARACEILGYKPEEIIGMSISDLTAPEDRERSDDLNASVQRGNVDRFEHEKRYLKRDGTALWVHVTVSALRDGAGRYLGSITTVEDINQRKEAEEKLRASEEKFRAVFQGAAVGIGRVDFQTACWFDANTALCNMVGYSRNEMRVTPWTKITHPDDVNVDLVQFRQLMSGELDTYTVEKRFIHKQGHHVWARLTLSAVRDADGRPQYEIAVVEDVTERKRTEQALRESERRFELAVRATNDAVWDWDLSTNSLWWSGGVSDLFGYAPQDIRPTIDWWHENIHPDDRERVITGIHGVIDSGQTFWRDEYRHRRDDGRYAVVVDRGYVMRDESGKPTRMLGGIQDVTERKRAEEALIRSEKLASVGRMAATVAHEINNPLAMVLNSVYIASLDENLSSRARQSIQTAEQELERVAHLTRQTLGFYRENSAPTDVDIANVAGEVVELYRPKFTHRDIVVQSEHTASLQIHGVAGEIRQVISNLLTNAIDASPRGGRLRIRSGRLVVNGTSFVRLTVADTGEGISPEHLKRIFEPFFTTKEAVGTGLGLWVSCEIVKRHQGEIKVRSRRGKGTVFSVLLPEKPHQTREYNVEAPVANAHSSRGRRSRHS